MSQFSKKSFFRHLAICAAVCALYLIFSRSPRLSYRIVNGLFVGGFPSLLLGSFRFAKAMGSFDLFLYTHRKLWKYGKKHEAMEEENEKTAPGTTEKLGSYADYLAQKKDRPSCKEPLLAGGLFLAASVLPLPFL